MKYYDAKGRELTARAGQTLPIGSMILEGRNWITLTETATVLPLWDEGNPYDEGSEPRIVGLKAVTASDIIAEKAKAILEAAEAAARHAKSQAEAAVKAALPPQGSLAVQMDGGKFKVWWSDGHQSRKCSVVSSPAEVEAVAALIGAANAEQAAKPAVAGTEGAHYREQGDPRHPGAYDGQKAAREWAEDAYRSGDSWSDD